MHSKNELIYLTAWIVPKDKDGKPSTEMEATLLAENSFIFNPYEFNNYKALKQRIIKHLSLAGQRISKDEKDHDHYLEDHNGEMRRRVLSHYIFAIRYNQEALKLNIHTFKGSERYSLKEGINIKEEDILYFQLRQRRQDGKYFLCKQASDCPPLQEKQRALYIDPMTKKLCYLTAKDKVGKTLPDRLAEEESLNKNFLQIKLYSHMISRIEHQAENYKDDGYYCSRGSLFTMVLTSIDNIINRLENTVDWPVQNEDLFNLPVLMTIISGRHQEQCKFSKLPVVLIEQILLLANFDQLSIAKALDLRNDIVWSRNNYTYTAQGILITIQDAKTACEILNISCIEAMSENQLLIKKSPGNVQGATGVYLAKNGEIAISFPDALSRARFMQFFKINAIQDKKGSNKTFHIYKENDNALYIEKYDFFEKSIPLFVHKLNNYLWKIKQEAKSSFWGGFSLFSLSVTDKISLVNALKINLERNYPVDENIYQKLSDIDPIFKDLLKEINTYLSKSKSYQA